ncbi:aminodeoxychorismate lyase [Marinobacterium sp. YM272]|uniref:aminodeoxychorismate lyase n=1 Tax=Marinobacterium sp. YM272 TaxID=3421654 RepID=UPI003D7FB1AD
MSISTLVNGIPSNQIPSNDRGLAYGHGLFETILIAGGKPRFWRWHMERLLDGCRRLGIASQRLQAELESDLEALVLPAQGAVKIVVTCGAGGRGYAVTEPLAPTRIITLSALPQRSVDPAEQGATLRWCQTRLARQPALAGLKHLNRLEQVLARAEWDAPDIHEGLTCDTDGKVTEGTMSNLFFRAEGRWYTPSLEHCGVAGVLRRWLIGALDSIDKRPEIGEYERVDLQRADEVLVCNSLIGIWPVIALDGQQYAIGETTRRLQSLLDKEYDA